MVPCGAWRGRRKIDEAAAVCGLSLRLASSGGRLVYITDALRPEEVPVSQKISRNRLRRETAARRQYIALRPPLNFCLFNRLKLVAREHLANCMIESSVFLHP